MSPPTRILLVGDERKGGTPEVVARHRDQLVARGITVATVLDRDAPLPDFAADAVVVFGGDGSLLATVRRMGQNQRPVLGINRGRLGFLTAFEYDQVDRALDLLLAGQLQSADRPLLLCHVVGPDGATSAPMLAVNDVVLGRAGAGGMIIVEARRDELLLGAYRGDGLIAATALGSTAYSMAAGGPVLAPDLEALVLTPLASHSLNARPLVMPIGSGLHMDLLETSAVDYGYCQIDGQVQLQVPQGGRVQVARSNVRFRQLGLGPGSFYGVLRSKFGFAGMAAPKPNPN